MELEDVTLNNNKTKYKKGNYMIMTNIHISLTIWLTYINTSPVGYATKWSKILLDSYWVGTVRH